LTTASFCNKFNEKVYITAVGCKFESGSQGSQATEGADYSAGFDTRTAGVNNALGLLANCEVIPQKLLSTSLMAVLQIEKN